MAMRIRSTLAALCASALLTGCSPSSLVDVQAPNTVVDPSLIGTVTGAVQLRAGAVAEMGEPLAQAYNNNLIITTGLFTDELTEGGGVLMVGADERRINDPTYSSGAGTNLYTYIHRARVRAQIAREALKLYATGAPGVPAAWRGELFALEGFTVLWLAENFCSGIPLTVVPLVGAARPTAGFTTQEMYTQAIALFDSAIVAGADSARFVNLARVGKGRALLGMGQFAQADAAVQAVPLDFVYFVEFPTSGDYINQVSTYGLGYFRAQDGEGTNGLVWSTDPRTALVMSPYTAAMWRPAKYNVTSGGTLDPDVGQPTAPIRLADGLEARLIHAEAALSAGGGDWLTTLNGLRQSCRGTATCAPVPGLTATTLPDTLADPGSDSARVTQLFRERAMWLYMTGHRLGDLRRLARFYHRNTETLWPTGTIDAPAFPPVTGTPLPENGTRYGSDVVFGPDPQERVTNPLYAGCYDYNP